MTIPNVNKNCRRVGVDPALYRKAAVDFTIQLSKASKNGEKCDEYSILCKLPMEEAEAYIKYKGYDKTRPNKYILSEMFPSQ